MPLLGDLCVSITVRLSVLSEHFQCFSLRTITSMHYYTIEIFKLTRFQWRKNMSSFFNLRKIKMHTMYTVRSWGLVHNLFFPFTLPTCNWIWIAMPRWELWTICQLVLRADAASRKGPLAPPSARIIRWRFRISSPIGIFQTHPQKPLSISFSFSKFQTFIFFLNELAKVYDRCRVR